MAHTAAPGLAWGAQDARRVPASLLDPLGLWRAFDTVQVGARVGFGSPYEAMMRPVFKDDEPLMIATGAVPGGLVGELQVVIIEHLSTR